MKIISSLVCIAAFFGHTSFAQELPRTASFGALVNDLNDSMTTALQVPSSKGTFLKQVFDGTSAHQAGLKNNDVLISFDSKSIENTAGFLAILKTYHGGDQVEIKYYRHAKLKTATLTLQSKAKETSKETKKQPTKTPKEKKAAKQAKKHNSDSTPIIAH